MTALADFGGLPEKPLHVGIVTGVASLSFDRGGQPEKKLTGYCFLHELDVGLESLTKERLDCPCRGQFCFPCGPGRQPLAH